MFSPRVSVLLTTYNNPMFLEALESVKIQTYKEYEILVLDDNSSGPDQPSVPSGSWKNIRYYKSNVRDEDRWKTARYAVQVNMGLKLATGEFIAYLCDDDLWMPDKLETVVNFLDSHPEATVVCGFQEKQQLGDGPEQPGIRDYKGTLSPVQDYFVMKTDPAFVVDHSSVVHRWPIKGGEAGWPTRADLRCADALYWRKLYQAGNEFYVIPKVLDIHRYHNQSWSSRMDRGEHLADSVRSS